MRQQNLNRDIIELIETVLVNKFTNLNRQEIEAMFALSDLKKSKLYQEALQEGEQKGEQKGELRGKQEVALNLLKIGMNINQVAKVTGLTIEQVRQL
jgi:predicted transposase/invertase (TIGR01784 family)